MQNSPKKFANPAHSGILATGQGTTRLIETAEQLFDKFNAADIVRQLSENVILKTESLENLPNPTETSNAVYMNIQLICFFLDLEKALAEAKAIGGPSI